MVKGSIQRIQDQVFQNRESNKDEEKDSSSIRNCSNFGCGRRLSLLESLCGNRCLEHMSGPDIIRSVKVLPKPERQLWSTRLIEREKDYIYQFNGEEDITILPRYNRRKLTWRISGDEKILVHRLTNDEFDLIWDFLKSLAIDYKNNQAYWNWRKVFDHERQLRIKRLSRS